MCVHARIVACVRVLLQGFKVVLKFTPPHPDKKREKWIVPSPSVASLRFPLGPFAAPPLCIVCNIINVGRARARRVGKRDSPSISYTLRYANPF